MCCFWVGGILVFLDQPQTLHSARSTPYPIPRLFCCCSNFCYSTEYAGGNQCTGSLVPLGERQHLICLCGYRVWQSPWYIISIQEAVEY